MAILTSLGVLCGCDADETEFSAQALDHCQLEVLLDGVHEVCLCVAGVGVCTVHA